MCYFLFFFLLYEQLGWSSNPLLLWVAMRCSLQSRAHNRHQCEQLFTLVEKVKIRKYWVESKNNRQIHWYGSTSTHESFLLEENLKKIQKRICEKHWRTSTFFWYLTGGAWDIDTWVVRWEAEPFHSSHPKMSGGTRYGSNLIYVYLEFCCHSQD